MGGMGSGRRHNQGGKDTVNDRQNLDVRQLQRKGLLTDGQSFRWSWKYDGESAGSIQIRLKDDKLTLIYRHKRDEHNWQSVESPVRLEWTPCTYGGRRAWFICPAKGCTRRVALLYFGEEGLFACRHCQGLIYECQRENLDDRATRQADKIRAQLQWEPGFLNGHGMKPKGMHRSTAERLAFKHDVYVSTSVSVARILQLIEAGLGGILEDLDLFGKNEK